MREMMMGARKAVERSEKITMLALTRAHQALVLFREPKSQQAEYFSTQS